MIVYCLGNLTCINMHIVLHEDRVPHVDWASSVGVQSAKIINLSYRELSWGLSPVIIQQNRSLLSRQNPNQSMYQVRELQPERLGRYNRTTRTRSITSQGEGRVFTELACEAEWS